MAFEICKNIIGTPLEYWDIQFFGQVLDYVVQDCAPLEIVKVRVEMGSNTGDNYLGCIYRVKLFYKYDKQSSSVVELKSCSLIIKCLPQSDANKFLHDCKVYLKEKVFYMQVLPLLELLDDSAEKYGPM